MASTSIVDQSKVPLHFCKHTLADRCLAIHLTVIHAQMLDLWITADIVRHVKMCHVQWLGDSILLLALGLQKFNKARAWRCDHNVSFSSFTLPFHHFQTELEDSIFPCIRWRIGDQHKFRINGFQMIPSQRLAFPSIKIETILVINWLTNTHIHLWQMPTRTSVATEQLNNITVFRLTKPVSLFSIKYLNIFNLINLRLIVIFFNSWFSFWFIKTWNCNVTPFIMVWLTRITALSTCTFTTAPSWLMTAPLRHFSFLIAFEAMELAFGGGVHTNTFSPALYGPSVGVVLLDVSCLRSAAGRASWWALRARRCKSWSVLSSGSGSALNCTGFDVSTSRRSGGLLPVAIFSTI